MLEFERELVATLTATDDPQVRTKVESFVAGSLGDMPEFLRVGVVAESLAFSLLARLRGGGASAALVRSLEASPIALVRQYVRLFRSLVLFAEHEAVT